MISLGVIYIYMSDMILIRRVTICVNYVAVPPSITVHPRSKLRISGQGVTLCCDGEGNPNPEFEW